MNWTFVKVKKSLFFKVNLITHKMLLFLYFAIRNNYLRQLVIRCDLLKQVGKRKSCKKMWSNKERSQRSSKKEAEVEEIVVRWNYNNNWNSWNTFLWDHQMMRHQVTHISLKREDDSCREFKINWIKSIIRIKRIPRLINLGYNYDVQQKIKLEVPFLTRNLTSSVSSQIKYHQWPF